METFKYSLSQDPCFDLPEKGERDQPSGILQKNQDTLGVGGGGCGEHLLLRAQEPARDVDG